MLVKRKKKKHDKYHLIKKTKKYFKYKISTDYRKIIIFKIILFAFIYFFLYLKKFYINSDFYKILPSKFFVKNKPIIILKEIFRSRKLIINDANITNEYIHFIRPIKEDKDEIKPLKDKKNINYDNFNKRNNQLNFSEYAKLCIEEKLINNTYKLKASNRPLISIIIPTFNNEKKIMKSIRSIQNQSLKNIEIIIVDDSSNDNSFKIFKLLLETDPRIRVFTHIKKMGIWRSKIDGLLYSRGKYIIFFDMGDLYEDNFVLEDAYNIIEKYKLDSIKMLFRLINDYNNLTDFESPFKPNTNYVMINDKNDIVTYNKKIFKFYKETIWNRLTRSDIYIKGLYLLSNNILNFYKNIDEDKWWSKLADKTSNDLLIINRYGYLNYKEGNDILSSNIEDPFIHEYIYNLYFDLDILPKEDNKQLIINNLKKWNNDTSKISLKRIKTKFYILDNLLYLLMKDKYVSNQDKLFLKNILEESKLRQKGL